MSADPRNLAVQVLLGAPRFSADGLPQEVRYRLMLLVSSGEADLGAGRAALQTLMAARAVQILIDAQRRHDTLALRGALGLAPVSVGRGAEALPHLEQAVKADPKQLQAVKTVGELYLQRRGLNWLRCSKASPDRRPRPRVCTTAPRRRPASTTSGPRWP